MLAWESWGGLLMRGMDGEGKEEERGGTYGVVRMCSDLDGVESSGGGRGESTESRDLETAY